MCTTESRARGRRASCGIRAHRRGARIAGEAVAAGVVRSPCFCAGFGTRFGADGAFRPLSSGLQTSTSASAASSSACPAFEHTLRVFGAVATMQGGRKPLTRMLRFPGSSRTNRRRGRSSAEGSAALAASCGTRWTCASSTWMRRARTAGTSTATTATKQASSSLRRSQTPAERSTGSAAVRRLQRAQRWCSARLATQPAARARGHRPFVCPSIVHRTKYVAPAVPRAATGQRAPSHELCEEPEHCEDAAHHRADARQEVQQGSSPLLNGEHDGRKVIGEKHRGQDAVVGLERMS
jgi:hypothetical protein